MALRWRVIARHRWVTGALISELIHTDGNETSSVRRYTATIRGWRNWHIWQGETDQREMKPRIDEIKQRVIQIRDRIDARDDNVFTESGAW